MKKLSLIAGLACLATIGGVFGAWTFGTAGVGEDTRDVASITIDTVIEDTGTVTATIDTGALSLYISQDKTDDSGYKIEATGVANVNFEGSYTDTTSGLNASYEVEARVDVTGGLAGYFTTGTEVTGVTHDDENKEFTIPYANIVAALQGVRINDVETKAHAQEIIAAVAGSKISLVVTVTPTYTSK